MGETIILVLYVYQNEEEDGITWSYHGTIAEFQAKVTEYAASEDNGNRIEILNLIVNVLRAILQTENLKLQNSLRKRVESDTN